METEGQSKLLCSNHLVLLSYLNHQTRSSDYPFCNCFLCFLCFLADESFSESLRRGVEAQVALLTNGNGTHANGNDAMSDDDTLADTASVSTLGDDVPLKERQKVSELLG